MAAVTSERMALIETAARLIPPTTAKHVFVAVDGVDGAGKTVFAEELVDALVRDGRPAARVSMDGFHRPREYRYRQGPTSAVGFWEDSFDYAAFERLVLDPLRTASRFQPAAHDVATDELLEGPTISVSEPTTFVVDGLFLHRPVVRDYWDFSVFLQVDFARSIPRMAQRDGSHPDPGDPSNQRYVGAQRIYFDECHPWAHANLVIDNNDLASPMIVTSLAT
jgi:uridine kinase